MRRSCVPYVAMFFGSAVFAGGLWLVAPRSFVPPPAPDYLNFYEPVAKNLVEGHGLVTASGQPAVRYPPGYPGFLAATFYVADRLALPRRTVAAVGVVLLHAAVATLLMWFAGRFWSLRLAVLPAVLWTCYPPALWMMPRLMSECPYTLLLLAAVVAFWIAAQGARIHYGWLGASGLALGLAGLCRPIFLPLPLVLAALLLLRSKNSPWRQRLAGAGVLLAAVLATIAPWELWLCRQTGRIVPLSTGGLPSAVDGLTWARPLEARVPLHVPLDVESFIAELVQKDENREIRSTTELAAWLWDQAVRRPLTVAKVIAYKAARSWYATDSHQRETFILLIQIPCLALATAGCVRAWRRGGRQRELAILVLSLVLATWLMVVMVLSVVVYMVPVMGLLFLPAMAVFDRGGVYE